MAWLGGRARARAAHEGQNDVGTFNRRPQHQVKAFSQQLRGTLVASAIPSKYTGKLFGMEYLLVQQGEQPWSKTEEEDWEIDEDFGNGDFNATELAQPVVGVGQNGYCLLSPSSESITKSV